jgi:hypothetical protein
MDWKVFGRFLILVGVAAVLIGVTVGENNASVRAGYSDNAAGGWYVMAAIGAVAAVVGIGLTIAARRSD